MLGCDDERAREADALAHAAGKLLRIGVLEAVEADEVDRRQRAPARVRLAHALGAQAELHIVEHGEPGKQREALEHHGDAVGRAVDRLAAIEHVAARSAAPGRR